jgi:hypothetical protein
VDLALQLGQEQQLRVSPTLIVLNQLLALSSQELQQLVQQELAENPALELIEGRPCPTCGTPSVGPLCPFCEQPTKPPAAPLAGPQDVTSISTDQISDGYYDSLGEGPRASLRPDDGEEFDPMSLVARRNYFANESVPRAWITRTLPREATAGATSLDAGKIQIYPASTLGLEYQVLYFPEYPALTTETHVVQGFDGDWIEWALWNAAIMALFKDDEMDPSQDQKAVRERGIIGERMLVNINRTQRAAPIPPTRHGGIAFRRF